MVSMGKRRRGKLIELKGSDRIQKRVNVDWNLAGSPIKAPTTWTGPRPVSTRPDKAAWNGSVTKASGPSNYHLPPELGNELLVALSSGAAIMAAHDLGPGPDKGAYPFSPLEVFRGPVGVPVPIPLGSILVYAGVVRASEHMLSNEQTWHTKQHRSLSIQVLKHTFITPIGRCIIHDFSLIRPA